MPLVRFPDSAGKTLLLMQYRQQSYLGSPAFTQSHMVDAHNIDMRDDDVLICSYRKYGCHWLWEITRMLRAATTNVDVIEKEKYMMEFNSQDNLLKLLPQRILNTHFFFRQLPNKVQDGKVKILFIYRNPKDVAVSFYNHHLKLPDYEYKGEFCDYVSGLFYTGKIDYGDIFTYTRDWEKMMDSRPDLPIFVVSYEELQADTFNKTKELAKFLKSSADDDTIHDIVEKCSFGNMLERKGKEWKKLFGEAVMYRKGKVGDWKNWFTVAQSEMADQICQKEMKGSRFKFQYSL